MRPLTALIVVLVAQPLLAGYAAQDAWLPIAGRGAGGYGRVFGTTLWITNVSSEAAEVSLTFCPSMQPNASPPTIARFRLDGGATRVLDDLGVAGVGAVRIRSTRDVVAHARVYTMAAGEPVTRSVSTAFNAVPAQFAIGNGETATLQGASFAEGLRYRMYVAETTGEPIYFSITLVDPAGRLLGEKRLYLGGLEPRVFDLRDEFPSVKGGYALLRLKGVNGNGRLVATGTLIAIGSGDGTSYEMTFTTTPRTRVGRGELAMYVAVALAVIAAAALALVRR